MAVLPFLIIKWTVMLAKVHGASQRGFLYLKKSELMPKQNFKKYSVLYCLHFKNANLNRMATCTKED